MLLFYFLCFMIFLTISASTSHSSDSLVCWTSIGVGDGGGKREGREAPASPPEISGKYLSGKCHEN